MERGFAHGIGSRSACLVQSRKRRCAAQCIKDLTRVEGGGERGVRGWCHPWRPLRPRWLLEGGGALQSVGLRLLLQMAVGICRDSARLSMAVVGEDEGEQEV